MSSIIRTILVSTLLLTFSAAAQDAAPKPSRFTRTILIVRHGHYIPDATDSTPGPGPLPLGLAQAKLVGARLLGMAKFDALYASPLTRANETARVIADTLQGPAIEVLPDLAECTPKTRRKEIIAKEKPESLAACAATLDALFARMFVPATGAPRREILVCHGNVTRYLTMRALGVDTEAWLEVSIGHASITQIVVEADGRFKVNSLGDIGHIPPNMQTGATGMAEKSLTVPK
jgi:serine/threonine-protein phosphatase PGAM5